MEADARYYWRRAVEELAAVRHSTLGEARGRHRLLAQLYVERLSRMGAPMPFSLDELNTQFTATPTPAAAA